MSEWVPVRKIIHDYNKARCYIAPVRDEKGRVNHWLSGLGMKGSAEDRYDPQFLKTLRDEHKMWRGVRDTHTQAAIARDLGVSVTTINKLILGHNKRSDKFDAQSIIKKFHYWLGIDKKHSPSAVCRREGLGSSWYDRYVVRAVRLEEMNATDTGI